MFRKIKDMQHWQKIAILLALFDFCAVVLSYSAALLMRFDFRYSQIPQLYLTRHVKIVFIYAAFCVAVYYFLKLYHSVWTFASYNELKRCIIATLATFLPLLILSRLLFIMPLVYYALGFAGQVICTIGIRFWYRFLGLLKRNSANEKAKNRVLLIGAGSAGQMLLRDIATRGASSEDRICAVIDDNKNKWGRYIENVKIVGGRESILEAVRDHDINKIFVAIPSAPEKDLREILTICSETGCELRQVPSMIQIIDNDVRVSKLKEVKIEDLLGRPTIKVNLEDVFRSLSGKRVLVTGGGGSIGSEICRQVAAHHPEMLIIFDIYENNAYDISNELKKKYPSLNLVTLIGSVRDSRRISSVFERYRPEIVYHAAAHKHVPLMEDSPCESIKNNAIGTYKTAYAALKYGTERFVLISTDKAVNPTNIMGASKRLCEMVIQSFAGKVAEGKTENLPSLAEHAKEYMPAGERKTQFVAVRFGNVLGSNGSVVPLFKKQIAEGGPVTVTHPDIIRYFMTVPEAVSLVLEAGTYAHGGEIFVLDMGEPVKIDTLARNLIRLSGLKPDVDIKIEYTGLRPGEKLFEEKLMAEEGMQKTANDLIHIGSPIPFDADSFIADLEGLMEIAYANDETNIRPAVAKIVKTYHPTVNA